MVLTFATAMLAAVLAQSATGESFNPTRRPRSIASSAQAQATRPVEPSLYPLAEAQSPQLDRATERAWALLAATQQQGQADRPVCRMRVIPAEPTVDRGIAIPVPSDRDYKINRIVPDCTSK